MQKTPFDLVALCRKMEAATSLASLRLYGEEAKTAPEEDKETLREVYRIRQEQLARKEADGDSA